MMDGPWRSRRSPVLSTHGIAASSQPIASQIGVQILQRGGNAADAAVAIAAALNVLQPTSTGIGGDAFVLFYNAATKTVSGINGSGCAPAALNIDIVEACGFSEASPLPDANVHTITVPGAVAAWVDTVDKFGSGHVTMAELLAPAIDLADNGFAVEPITAYSWKKSESLLRSAANGHEMLIGTECRAPYAGERIRLPNLANTFREIAQHGKKGFYEGRVASSIVDTIASLGGLMSLDDLRNHQSRFDEPIFTEYRGIRIYEMPPNTQGLVALIALNVLEGYELSTIPYHSPKHLHLLIEALRLSFADARAYVCDPAHAAINDAVPTTAQLLSKSYAAERRKMLSAEHAVVDVIAGTPDAVSNTVYFGVVDAKGNACSFINSNYKGFGTGHVAKGCGFTLQNRGQGFSLNRRHPNALAGGKRPYHTIIPGMAVDAKTGELYACFGVMGGFMQPQGHVQVLSNMIDFGMDPQAALDAPRVCIMDGTADGQVAFEEGISENVIASLKSMGHKVHTTPQRGFDRVVFGMGQIIRRLPNGVLCAGSDPRGDGAAIGY